jgi:allantoin racemase
LPARILLINPNTSLRITAILAEQARSIAGCLAEIHAVTAPYGSAALETPADLHVAARAVLDVIASSGAFDAAIIGAFGDPGLDQAAAIAPMPVFGLGRSGLLEAARNGRRFAIVTVGEKLRADIERAVGNLGLAGPLVALRFLPQGVLDIANDRAAILDAAVEVAAACASNDGAEVVLFGGAPFAGIGADIAHRLSIPVLDGLTAAMQHAMGAVRPPDLLEQDRFRLNRLP